MQPFPLNWPKGWPRTANPESSKFQTSLAAALKNVNNSLRSFGADSKIPLTEIVISSNVSLGSDNPKDSGVAVWFMWDGQLRCIPVDKYKKVQENLQAIHHIVESRRTELRHGGLHILRQAFVGFKGLPEPHSHKSCWDILGIAITSNKDSIVAAYKKMSKSVHPDKGGSHDDMANLNSAYRDALMFADQ